MIRCLMLLTMLAALGMTGCADRQARGAQTETENTLAYEPAKEESVLSESKEIAESYRDIYETAVNNKTLGALEVTRRIIERVGEGGYAAVDTQNQIDMVNAALAERFCGHAERKQEAGLTLICVMQNGDFIRYDFETAGGELNVKRSTVNWKSGVPEEGFKEEYPAFTWDYTGGYLFFEEYRPEGFDGPSGHTAVRVKPLDERCRQLNRQYLQPVGYGLNNIFTADWSEEDYGELNFYDLYERLYQMKYGSQAFRNAGESDVAYEVPAGVLEPVFMSYFKIDRETLRRKIDYSEENDTYRYRPRGADDIASTPLIPYPEVVSYEEQADGTLKLTVNAVWSERSLAKAFVHEVVIRPLSDGGFQYVSNKCVPSSDSVEPEWYTERKAAE